MILLILKLTNLETGSISFIPKLCQPFKMNGFSLFSNAYLPGRVGHLEDWQAHTISNSSMEAPPSDMGPSILMRLFLLLQRQNLSPFLLRVHPV